MPLRLPVSNFSVFLFVCLSVGFTKKFLPANTTPKRVAANQSTHSYVNSSWSCWNAQLLSTYLHDAPFGLRNIHFWQVLKRKVLSHQCKIAWGECFTKFYWNGRKQQLIILLTEFQTGKKHKVDSFSATYKVLLLPATSKNKFINEQRRILSNSVSKQAPTLLGTSLKILKYSKDKLTTGTSESSQSYIVVISHSRSIYTLRNRLFSISWHNYAIATKQFSFFLS